MAMRLLWFCKLKSDSGGIRTPNRQSRNLIFYPVELRSHKSKDIASFQSNNNLGEQ